MTPKRETHPLVHDVAASLGLLTRVPVDVDTDLAMTRSAKATWAYPVIGMLLGGVGMLVFVLLHLIGLPIFVAVVLLIGFQIIVTGAMHEDGLADCADGLWGGWTKERRLEIMKDSHIGVYGVAAIALALLLKAAALGALAWSPLMAVALIAGGAVSRTAMVVVMYALPNARGGGLSQSVGRPPLSSVWIAVALAGAATIGMGFLTGHILAIVVILGVAGLTTAACIMIAKRKIGGQTGDVLGATQQVSDIAILIALSALAY